MSRAYTSGETTFIGQANAVSRAYTSGETTFIGQANAVSRAYTAAIGITRRQFYTFDFGNNFQIVLAEVASVASNADTLTVGPIEFNLKDCVATFRGSRIGSTTWIASEYDDTLIVCNLPATRDEITYLVNSLTHLLNST